MKVLYGKVTNELVGECHDSYVGNDNHGVTDPPTDWSIEEKEIWKYDDVAEEVVLKTGQELADAQAIVFPRIIERLMQEHAGALVHPRVIGQLEGAADVVVQMVHHWVNDTAPTQDEKDAWNSWHGKCASSFKVTLATLATEEDGMAADKATARQAEVDMKADPDWPV